MVQLLETPFVNLINYASLVTTNAARHRFVAGKSKTLLEFGLRRAQVPLIAPPSFISLASYLFYVKELCPILACRVLMVELVLLDTAMLVDLMRQGLLLLPLCPVCVVVLPLHRIC